MKFTKASDLVTLVLVAGAGIYLIMRLAYGSLPKLPALAGVALLPIAIAEVWLAFSLRARIQRKPDTRPVQPLFAARSVALAKASSLAGSIMLGVWLGVLAYVVPLSGELVAANADTIPAVIGALCAGSLIGSGLWLEHCLRTPKNPEDSDPGDRSRF